MTSISLISLCGAMLVLAASPGPGVFATVARSMASGFKSSLPVIAGIILGDLIYLMLAIFGMAAVAHVLGKLFVLVKIAGGIYLIFLGLRIWAAHPAGAPADKSKAELSDSSSFLSGLLITLSNPKVILFYCGFLPNFLNLAGLGATDIMVVCVVIGSILALVLLAYSYLAGRARQAIYNNDLQRSANRSAGAMMIFAGVWVAIKG